MAITAVGLAGFCALAIGPGGALGQQATPIDEQVTEAADDLADANAKVNKVKGALTAAEAELAKAQSELDAAATRGREAQQTADIALQAVRAAEREVAALESQIAKVEARVKELRAEVGQLARIIYTSGGQFDEIQIILDARDPAEFAERLAAVRRVSRGNDQVLDRLAVAKTEMDALLARSQQLQDRAQARRDEAQRKSDEAEQATQDAESARQEVGKLVAKRKLILASADSERGAVRSQYDELAAEQARIAAKIKAAIERERREEAERRRREQEANRPKPNPANPAKPQPAKPQPAKPRPASSSVLSWPVPGYSAGGKTGPRVHPVYGYSSCHTGVDIGAGYGVPIRSAGPGYVVSTDSGGPYGNHTVVSHGNGLSTMYAHQSSFNVSEGQRVGRGQVIGYVGSTGYSTGPHLHFEVHVNGVPYEPMGWFGWSKYRVTCY